MQEKEVGTDFITSVNTYDSVIYGNLFVWANQDSTTPHTRKNSKLLKITSDCSVAHMRRDFLACYTCSYYKFHPIIKFFSNKYADLVYGCCFDVFIVDLEPLLVCRE